MFLRCSVQFKINVYTIFRRTIFILNANCTDTIYRSGKSSGEQRANTTCVVLCSNEVTALTLRKHNINGGIICSQKEKIKEEKHNSGLSVNEIGKSSEN